MKEFLEKSRRRGGDTESYARMLRCPAETMASALNSISVNHKNIYTYLTKIGLSEEQLFKVSHRLIDKSL